MSYFGIISRPAHFHLCSVMFPFAHFFFHLFIYKPTATANVDAPMKGSSSATASGICVGSTRPTLRALCHRQELRQGKPQRSRTTLSTRCQTKTSQNNAALALKEWAPIAAAVASGEQTVLLRKGGIREPAFAPRARDFLLFETGFHADGALLSPEARVRYSAELAVDPKSLPRLTLRFAARVTGAWTTHEPGVLQALRGLHVLGEDFLQARLRWRPAQPLTLLEVRGFTLRAPAKVPSKEEYWGCFSWVDVEGLPAGVEMVMEDAEPGLSDVEFTERQAVLRGRLAGIEAVPLEY
jgi:hypothetical protein